MMDRLPVYLRMKRKIAAQVNQSLFVKDIAYVSATTELQKKIKETKLYTITSKNQELAVIDCFQVIELLQKKYPEMDCQQMGATETIIHIEHKRKRTLFLRLMFAWIVLFIGTAMTIMNFHEDVNMLAVHQKIHLLLTGEHTSSLFWIQIPYSFGLGLGMVLFLNHWFKKRINEEPSPLEIELFTYQQDLDNYIAYYENDLNREDYAP